VDQLQIRHLGAVLVRPLHFPQEHVPDHTSHAQLRQIF
jgi:hypothetical protein